MKSKKGFTLVELMAVIVILAIVIAISIPTYSKIKNSIDVKNFANKKELIKAAATKFAEDTNITAVFVKELVENGYLESDDEDGNVYGLDSENKKVNINCYVILTEQKNGMFYSEFINYNYMGENKECDYNIPNKLTNGFKILMYEEISENLKEELKYDSNKKWWTKNNVILEASIPGETTSIEKIEWYEGYNNEPIKSINGENLTEYAKTLTVTTDSVLQQNYTAKLTYKDGKVLKARVRVYIDKIKPNFYESDAKNINDVWKAGDVDKSNPKYIDYNIKAYDNESGLYGYKEIGENETCPSNISDYKKSKKIVFKNNGKKYICLIDNVGNTMEKSKEVEVTHIDDTPMNCNFSVEGTKGNKDNNNLLWYTSSIRIYLNPEKIGLSGVMLTMADEKGNKYETTGYITADKFTYFRTNEINDNRKVTVNGTIKNQAGTNGKCSINVGVETSIAAPAKHKIDPYYNKIIVHYTSGRAISGIKNEVCELYDSSNNLKKSYNPGEKKYCTFEGLEYKENTKYKIRRCITSNAGNSDCSEVEVEIPGYCTSTTSMNNGSAYVKPGSSCSKKCGGGEQEAIQPKKDVSNYNKETCKTYEVNTTLSCNTMGCCSKTNAHTDAWGQCSAKCGGGIQYRNVWYTSAYDGSITCQIGNPAEPSSQSCNTMDCCSSIKPGNPYDNPGCNASCGPGEKTVITPYYSTYNGKHCKDVKTENVPCNLGPCGETYAFSLEKDIDDATAVGATSVDISPFLHINNYSYLEYDIKVDSRSLGYSGVCGLNIIGSYPDDGLYPLVNGDINLSPHANDIMRYKERIDRVYKDVNKVESTPLKSFQTFTVGDVGKFEIRCHAGTNGDRGGKVYVNGTITLYK